MRSGFVLTALAAMVVSGSAAAAETTGAVLDLGSACRLAISSNSEVASAAASAEEAKSATNKARSALLPRIGISSGYNYLSKETIFGGVPVLQRNTVQNRVELQQILYSGGRVQANVRQAQHGYAAAQYASGATRADVLTRTAAAYLKARQAREAIGVAESTVRSLEASYDAAQKQFEAGTVTKSDVLRSEVALTSARTTLVNARNAYGVAMANLKATIGLPQDTPITLSEEPVDGALDSATSLEPVQRPEVKAGEEAVRAAEAGAKAARAGRMPTALLVADFLNEPEGSQFPRRSNSVGAGLMVTWNAFDGGLVRASIAEADAAVRRSREDLETTRRAVNLQIETARLDLDSARERLAATTTQIASAEESLRALRAGYNEGITPIVDVLSGETALTEARVSRLVAEYDVKLAQVNLLRALGRAEALLAANGGN